MKKSLKIISTALCAVLCGSALAACGEGGDTERKVLDEFTFVATEPVTLNMKTSASNLDTYVFYLTSAMLYRTYRGVTEKEICDTMTVSDDGRTYTYTIKDAVYANGDKILADDFVYYLTDGYLSSENCAYYVGGSAYYNGETETCEGIYTVDEKTFVVTLVEPIVTFDGELEIYPLQRAFAEAKGDSLGGTAADYLSSGPYVLTSWVTGSSLTYEKNDKYIAAETSFPTKKVTQISSENATTIKNLYDTGAVQATINGDTAFTDAPNYADYANEDFVTPDGAMKGVEMNTAARYYDGSTFVPKAENVVALMNNLNFRKALSYAINRTALINALEPSTATAYNRYVDPGIMTDAGTPYVDAYSVNLCPLEGDATLAKSYLATALKELGYASVSELPTLRYLVFDAASYSVYAEAIVDQWSQVLGLKNITIDMQPVSSAISKMVFLDYEIYFQALTLDPDYETTFLDFWTTGGGVSDAAGFTASGLPASWVSVHHDAAYDEVMAKAVVEFDQAKRFALIQEAEQLLYDSYVYFPIKVGVKHYFCKSNVEGFVYADNVLELNETVVYSK